MIEATIYRFPRENDKQTLGLFDSSVFDCYTLELPYLENQRSISCIPLGSYVCVLRWSEKYGWHYHVLDVEGRTWILIHFGNYFKDTRGCILIGNALRDINGDGICDVTSSKATIKKMIKAIGKEFKLTIK